MKPKAKTTVKSAAAILTACAALAIGYPMISARLDAQPVKPEPVPATVPAPAPATQPAEKPGDKPVTPTPAPTVPPGDEKDKDKDKDKDKPPTDKPGDKPTDKPGDKPAGTATDKPGDKPADKPAATTTEPAKPKDPPKPKEQPKRDDKGRVIQPDELTTLAFKNVTVDQMIPFIVEATGKVVIPRPDLLPRKITIINDQPIKRSRALELVFYALQQEGIGVIESNDLIIMRNIAEIVQSDVPLIGANVDLSGRDDWGRIVEKVFAPNHASAQHIVEALEEGKTLPDYAKMTLDPDSNQLTVMGNIGLLQRVEAFINALDVPSAESLQTETFHLRYADAEKIAANIKELFGPSTNKDPNAQGQPNYWRGYGEQAPAKGRGKRSDTGSAATSQNLRATPNTQQNSVTVLAEQTVLDQIADAIEHEWDLPLKPESVIPKVYQLINTDPLKIKAVLDNLFSGGKATSSSTGATGNPGGGGGRGGGGGNVGADPNSSGTSQGAGRLAGQYAIEALTDSGRLVVIAKSPDNLEFIDKIIEGLDQPKATGLPIIIELKHASAEELAEQLNALLAQEGTQAWINRQETGLTNSATAVSPFAADPTATTGANGATPTAAANQLQFWWQRARPPTDNAGTSNIVSKVRIVPVWRQNALMIMSPPEYQQSLAELIERLDRPGRQVLIAGIVVEISLGDSTALGLRWSNSGISPTNTENVIGINNMFTGQKNNLINSLFDTSVLNTTANLNLILQALAQKTSTNILSEPRVFTSDNQEAEFFDGQDVPFVNELQNTTNGGQATESFTYRPVGIRLNVRPRITIKKDVDLRITLELSSIAPGQAASNAFIVDRRQTTTHLIVKDGQTVVLSGIMRSETSNITRKVPLLGDIPLLGALFTSVETTKTNTELIAFITPVVVENTDDANSLYETDRTRLEQMRKQFGEKGASIPVLPRSSDPTTSPGTVPTVPKVPSTPAPEPGLTPASTTPADGAMPATPSGGAYTGLIPGHVPNPISDVVIGALDMDGAMLEWNARRAAATNPTLDAATRQRLLSEAEKCKQRIVVTAAETKSEPIAAPAPASKIPAPISDAAIGALDQDGAMKEWTARKKAAAKPDLDAATKQRLLDEAERCKERMHKARDEPSPAMVPSQKIPAPISDAAIAALDRDGAINEWVERKKAAADPDLDAATRQRLVAEAEKCKQRMQKAFEEGK